MFCSRFACYATLIPAFTLLSVFMASSFLVDGLLVVLPYDIASQTVNDDSSLHIGLGFHGVLLSL
jgi:hypothetical protein